MASKASNTTHVNNNPQAAAAIGGNSTAASFRQKVAAMKDWKPESPPSNRDRLELYALHKQAVSGDAPLQAPTGAISVSERSQYQAWKSKRGLSQEQAMTQYLTECNRQVRVYGNKQETSNRQEEEERGQTPLNTPASSSGNLQNAPRGLAAIPLLCAAAAESRVAYLRRLEVTTPDTAWWSRQEALCSMPGTLGALPETFLLKLATTLERASLATHSVPLLPPSVWQSLLWPLHNSLLAVWMGLIVCIVLVNTTVELASTLLWGARRTGRTLASAWQVQLTPTARSIESLCEPHQVISVRLVGLVLWPALQVEGILETYGLPHSVVGASVVWIGAVVTCAWYFVFFVPWMWIILLVAAAWSGACFAVIEFAGV